MQDLDSATPRPGWLRRAAAGIWHVPAGIVFLPTDAEERERCKSIVATICAEEGQTLVGWRVVPTNADAADLGHGARDAAPHIEQLFVAAGPGCEGDAFERKLYLLRKRASHRLRGDTTLRQALHAMPGCSCSSVRW